MIYEREDLEQKDCTELHAIAEQRGLLADFDDEDDVDEHLLIGLILDAQKEDLDAEVKECEEREREEDEEAEEEFCEECGGMIGDDCDCDNEDEDDDHCDECGESFDRHEGLDEFEQDAADKQRAEDDRNPLINRRDGQDGSDDYC